MYRYNKMRMVDLGSQRIPLHVIDRPTAVDCSKDVRFGRSFRSLVECMVPYCCAFQPSSSLSSSSSSSSSSTYTLDNAAADAGPTNLTLTGTFFGYRRSRVRFCLHDSSYSRAAAPLLLLEFAIPTAYLAREMQHGLLRIALECDRSAYTYGGGSSLFAVPVWSMYCNGRKVGFAVRRQMSEGDAAVFKLMQSVSVGAGVLPGESKSGDGDLLYLRASFQRVVGSVDSQSFHMINPEGSTGQQLSIFLLRT
uniref:Protein MIZU-KUSSEI 1 n=1 Tax=Ananas comosus var. bracteatus TaxID=296719 RepID=A0A6V7NL94_ANACO|nr:unnamed protein product [Ananas comosus var. bracteatus]